jgi:hypothetical protein
MSLYPSRFLDDHEGELRNGEKPCSGTYHFADGNKYVGDWVNEKSTRQGVFTCPRGDGYEKCCSTISRHSPGIGRNLSAAGTNDADVPVRGQLKDGEKHGKGTYHFADGIKYVGDWVDGKMMGQGVYTWPSGDRYERCCSTISRYAPGIGRGLSAAETNDAEAPVRGQFKDDKKNGEGTYYFADGDKYVGDWVDDRRTGQSVYTWPSGDRYERCCSTPTRHGLADRPTLSAGHSNEVEALALGRYKDDRMNGTGTYYYTDGNKYVGDWVDEKPTGQGVFIWLVGDRYES